MTQALAPSLPVQLTTFIGREKEIEAVDGLLHSTRLLTLTGMGGAGKTRLAAALAERAAPRFEATGWVDLAPLSDSALVGPLVANTLGYREEGGRSAVDTLINRVCERSTLVILDNCEHLVDACAALAESLLKTCPRIRIVATSREALGVSGEQAWLVPPLSLPAVAAGADAVRQSEAGRLFLERARGVAPTFTVDQSNAAAVAQICRRLDGIPLAIELAAARVRVLAPDQIAARLDDAFKLLAAPGRTAPPRHRTLRETIDWSHALLDPEEAALFRRLAVFAGSFSLDAVEALCRQDVLDLLAALVDKSLVIMESTGSEARYRMLETLRQYARERLAAAGDEAELRARHARFFTELVAAREKDTFGGAGDPEWTARLIAEEGNLRAASEWAEETGDRVTALRLCAALHWHWFARGHFRDGWQLLESALRHADQAPPLEAGKAFAAAATCAFWLGKLDQVVPNARQGVALLRGQNDPWHLSYALVSLGLGLSMTTPAESEPLLAEGTRLAREHAPRSVLLAFALYWHGRFCISTGDLGSAEQLLIEAHGLGAQLGHPPAMAHPLTMLGLVRLQQGMVETASLNLGDALKTHAENSDVLGCIWSLEGRARVAQQTGDRERAAQLLAFVRAERERIGAVWSPFEQRAFGAMARALDEALGDQARAVVRRGEALDIAAAVDLALGAPSKIMMFPTPMPPARLKPKVPAATPATLRVQALGPLQIEVNGEPLDRAAWASTKPRELLLLLLCHREGRTREQVGLAFWPEASAEQVRNNFHVTLHRLRKTLGAARWITLAGDTYALDRAVKVDFDAERFEREVTAARKALDPEALAAALALYRGDFLEHEHALDWHLDLRDRLRLKYVEAIATLAEQHMKRDAWAAAAEWWRRLITVDELDERAYRELMTCHARLGERSQVQQLYKRLEQALGKQLQAQPEPKTQQLFRALIATPAPSL